MRTRLPLKAVGRGSGWVFSLSFPATDFLLQGQNPSNIYTVWAVNDVKYEAHRTQNLLLVFSLALVMGRSGFFSLSCCAFLLLILFCKVKIHPILYTVWTVNDVLLEAP